MTLLFDNDMFKKHSIAFAILLIGLAPPFAESSALATRLVAQQEEIKSFGESRDLTGLENFVESNLAAWQVLPAPSYGEIMLHAVQTLASEPFENSELQQSLVHKYARKALEKAPLMSLETQVKLVLYTERDLFRLPEQSEWSRLRKEEMKAWFQVWKRLREAYDPEWDPEDVPLINVNPPPGSGVFAGQAPESIEDPELRAQYIRAIEANRKRAEYYGVQYKLRKLNDRFFKRAESYIIRAYSRRPPAQEELRANLEEFVDSESARIRIFDKVTKNTTAPGGGSRR